MGVLPSVSSRRPLSLALVFILMVAVLVTLQTRTALAANPVVTPGQTFSVLENSPNSTIVGTVLATDPDSNLIVSFAIVGGTGMTAFAIDTAGVLTVLDSSQLDREATASFDLLVTATDDQAETSASETVTVTLDPVNESNPVFTSDTTPSVPENTTTVVTLAATDADVPAQTITFSLTGAGADFAKFQITAGTLEFKAAPDFENPTDAGADNVYDVVVRASDGAGRTTDVTHNVTVTNVNDPPSVTAIAGPTIDEGSPFSGTVATFTDQDAGDTHTATIDWSDGPVDGPSATTSPVTGSHTYADNGSFLVTITVDDGGNSDSDSFTMTVNNVAPVVNAGADIGPIADGTVVSGVSVSFTDPGADTHTAVVNWGDGTGSTALVGTVPSPFTLPDHTYADATSSPFTVTVTVTDSDGAPGNDTFDVAVAAVVITETGGSTDVIEGGAGDTYTINLTAPPVSDVVITITTDSEVNAGASSVTFTGGVTPSSKVVSVSAVDDDIDENAHTGLITHSVSGDPAYAGQSVASITANISDNDTAGVTVTGSPVPVTESGATGSYTVVLDTEPTGSVKITPTVVGPNVTVSPASGTFTTGNWGTPQSFTVTAVDDALIEDQPHEDTITHAATSPDAKYSGIGIASVTASVTDDDSAGVSIIQTGDSTTVTEGTGSDSYSVVLTAEPVANVIVSATVTGTQVTVSPAFRTFTPANWFTPQNFTVIAIDDDIDEGSPHADTITHAVTSLDTEFDGVGVSPVAVSITDNDTVGVTVASNTVEVTEGSPGVSFTVVLNTMPSASVTITQSVVVGQVTATPVSRTFTTANWNTPQTFTVTAVDDGIAEGPHADTVTLASTSADASYTGVAISTVTVNITDDDVLNATVTGPTVGAPGIAAVFNVTINSAVGPASFAWQAIRSGVVVATGTAQNFSFTPAAGGTYFVSVIVTDNNGDSPAVAVLFKVLGDIEGSVFVNDIIWMATLGITRGCNPPANDLFCPNDKMTRGQFAAFMNRALKNGPLSLPSTSTDFFTDDDTSIFENDINKLAASRITRGCNPPANTNFCPTATITRGQLAALFTRAFGLMDRGTVNFIDDNTSIFEADIEKLATAGITRGCNPPANTMFCPLSAVTRGQFAAFLHRAESFFT